MYRKKLHQSKLFGEDVWIVNIHAEQALTDPDIVSSGNVVFTEKETASMRGIPDEQKQIIFFVKKNLSKGCEFIYHGPEVYRGEPIVREEGTPYQPKTKTGLTSKERHARLLARQAYIRERQGRMFGP